MIKEEIETYLELESKIYDESKNALKWYNDNISEVYDIEDLSLDYIENFTLFFI